MTTKRWYTALAFLALLVWVLPAMAHDGDNDEDDSTVTVQGEIVDMGCYMGHGAKGADHKSCALKCISNGMPMGLLTDDGKLYLLTMSHTDPDPFNRAKELAAEHVSITGESHSANGMLSLEVATLNAPVQKKE